VHRLWRGDGARALREPGALTPTRSTRRAGLRDSGGAPQGQSVQIKLDENLGERGRLLLVGAGHEVATARVSEIRVFAEK